MAVRRPSSDLSWSPYIFDFDTDSAEDVIQRWLRADGTGILCALPPGPDLDAAFTELAQRETRM
jgi:hypothetical protein